MTEHRCPNCGSPAPDSFCSSCGQRQGSLFPSVWSWAGDMVDELLLVEARLPRTLKALVWPPGALTGEWRRGRRAAYVHPFRLYLLAALPCFLLLSSGDPRTTFFGVLTDAAFTPPEGLPSETERAPPPLAADADGAARAADSVARGAWWARADSAYAANVEGMDRIAAGTRFVMNVLPGVVGLVLVPLMALVMIPVMGLKYRYIEHMVFSLHAHTLLFLWGTLVLGIGRYLGFWVLLPGLPLAYLHVTFSAKLAYASDRPVVLGGMVLVSLAHLLGFVGLYLLLARLIWQLDPTGRLWAAPP